MFPDLVDIGFLHLKTYGACMAVGFLLCWTLATKLCPRKDLPNLLMTLMLGGVLGSRIAYVVEHWSAEFAANPAAVVRVDQGGLMFYGGLVLDIAIFLVWCRVKKADALAVADVLCTVIPLGHACGRIGCFFFGCCYGKVSTSCLAVRFPKFSPAWYEQMHGGLIPVSANSSLPVLPTQLFESAALLVLFAALLALYLKRGRGTTAAYLAGYGVIRFGMEFLRGDPRAAFWGLSIGQAVSLGLILAAVAVFLVSRTRARREPTPG